MQWSKKLQQLASNHIYENGYLIQRLSNDKELLLHMTIQYGTHLHGLIRNYGDPNLTLGIHGGVPYFKGIMDVEMWSFTNPIVTRIGKAKMKLVSQNAEGRYDRDDIRNLSTLLSYSLPAHRLVLPTVMAKLEKDGCKVLIREERKNDN